MTDTRRFALRPLDLRRDLVRVHAWMNDPDVAQFWEKAWPIDEIDAYLQRQLDYDHSAPYIGELDDVAMSYWECYRADLDPLAQFYPARAHDLGIHLLLGPADYRGQGLAVPLLRTVTTGLLQANPRASRVVAEPDVHNLRSIRAFERAGYERTADVELPNKSAALMVFGRSENKSFLC